MRVDCGLWNVRASPEERNKRTLQHCAAPANGAEPPGLQHALIRHMIDDGRFTNRQIVKAAHCSIPAVKSQKAKPSAGPLHLRTVLGGPYP
jgi:hypothetical protein